MSTPWKAPAQEAEPSRSGPLWRVWGEVHRGAGHPPRVGTALPEGRAARFAHGASLPWHVLRALLAEPRTRRRYLTVSLAQAGTILALALLVTSGSQDLTGWVGDEVEQQVEEAQARREVDPEGARQAEEEEREAFEAHGPPSAGKHVQVRVNLGGEHSMTRAVVRTLQGGEGKPRKGWGRWFVYLGALLSSLQLAQWAVIALSRDFHTHLSREASLLMGVPTEDEPLVPRVRVNVGWMRSKLQRRWRALLVFAVGAPVLWPIKWALPGGEVIASVLLSLWGTWWFVVFTAGKSALAWREETAREPGFLRAWKALTSWFWPLRVHGSLWTRVTRPVFSPIAQVERGPWGFAGLALVRALSILPLVKCFLRPLIPVASAHLLLAEERSSTVSPTP